VFEFIRVSVLILTSKVDKLLELALLFSYFTRNILERYEQKGFNIINSNKMATGSLSSVPKRLRMVEDFSCTCCLEQNLTESADIYCEQCLRFYCKKCVILHSQLFTKHMTCGREDIKKWPVSKAVEDFLRKCEVHADESLTQFCHDHGQLCCSACVGTIHRYLTHLYFFSY